MSDEIFKCIQVVDCPRTNVAVPLYRAFNNTTSTFEHISPNTCPSSLSILSRYIS